MPGTLREITKPEECRAFKKIVHLNDLIVILTEAGKLFIHGDEPDEVFQVEDNDDENDAECFKEVDIGQTFQMYSPEQDGKIVDIDIGVGNSDDEDTIAAIVTEHGKLYAIHWFRVGRTSVMFFLSGRMNLLGALRLDRSIRQG